MQPAARALDEGTERCHRNTNPLKQEHYHERFTTHLEYTRYNN